MNTVKCYISTALQYFVMTNTKIKKTKPTIFIPIASHEKLIRYQNGVRGLLRKIEVENCDPETKEDIKAVYELLTHLRHNAGIAPGEQDTPDTKC